MSYKCLCTVAFGMYVGIFVSEGWGGVGVCIWSWGGCTPPGQTLLGQTPNPADTPPAQCMLGYITTPLPSACWDTPSHVDRITDRYKNITFPQLNLRTVIKSNLRLSHQSDCSLLDISSCYRRPCPETGAL